MVLDPRNQNELIEADSCSTMAVFPQGRMQSQEQSGNFSHINKQEIGILRKRRLYGGVDFSK